MSVVGGNTVINRNVFAASGPALEGLYFTDGSIATGTSGARNDDQLYVRGSLVANGGFNLQRDGGDSNKTKPSEFFEYAPDLLFNYPSSLGTRSFIWKEVAP